MHSIVLTTFSEREGPKLLLRCSEESQLDTECCYSTEETSHGGAPWSSHAVTHMGTTTTTARFTPLSPNPPQEAATGFSSFYNSFGANGPAPTGFVKSVCLRALSIEHVGPHREGKVLFGQKGRVFSLAFVFQLLDSEARGMHRTFAFVYTHPDPTFLMASVQYIGATMGDIAASLKRAAKHTFQSPSRKRHSLSVFEHDGGGESQGGGGTLLCTSLGSSLGQSRRRSELRSLAELVNDPLLLPEIHRKLAFTLHSVSCRLAPRAPRGLTLTLPTHPQVHLSLYDVRTALVRGPPPGAAEVCIDCVEPSEAFRAVLFHLGCGDQVIVTADNPQVASAVATLLGGLLPPDVRKVERFAAHYTPGYACNVIALSQAVFADEVGTLPEGCVHVAFGRTLQGTMLPARGVVTRCSSMWVGKGYLDTAYARDFDRLGAIKSASEAAQASRLAMKYWRVALLFASYTRSTRMLRSAIYMTQTETKRCLQMVGLHTSSQPLADTAILRFLGTKPRK